jgi:hypothetical protein
VKRLAVLLALLLPSVAAAGPAWEDKQPPGTYELPQFRTANSRTYVENGQRVHYFATIPFQILDPQTLQWVEEPNVSTTPTQDLTSRTWVPPGFAASHRTVS